MLQLRLSRTLAPLGLPFFAYLNLLLLLVLCTCFFFSLFPSTLAVLAARAQTRLILALRVFHFVSPLCTRSNLNDNNRKLRTKKTKRTKTSDEQQVDTPKLAQTRTRASSQLKQVNEPAECVWLKWTSNRVNSSDTRIDRWVYGTRPQRMRSGRKKRGDEWEWELVVDPCLATSLGLIGWAIDFAGCLCQLTSDRGILVQASDLQLCLSALAACSVWLSCWLQSAQSLGPPAALLIHREKALAISCD